MGNNNGRGSSRVYPFDPPGNILTATVWYENLYQLPEYEKYLPFDYIKVTNSSGYRADLWLDGVEVCAIFGKTYIDLSDRKFQSFALHNDSGFTINQRDIQVVIQKQGEGVGGGF